ncbi:MAG TPA: cysteine desulfurase family protein [Bacillota bacterium]|nr:cysteine desulfurase family protein [Bacillota bacterium]
MIYLDNSATTVVDSSVLESYTNVVTQLFANPSSIHGLGSEVEAMLSKAKSQIAQLLHIQEDEIIMTSGGTEGNNLAIKGIAHARKRRGNHIITTVVEHPSVYETCQSLEKEGFDVTYLPVNEWGIIQISDLEEAITDETILVTVMHVNNEIGSVQPIEEIGRLLKKHSHVAFHVDGIQSIGKIPIHLKRWNIDACTFSAHKVHGVKGTGMLYKRKDLHIVPLFNGGSQEQGFRPGTEHVAGIISFARALRIALEKQQNKNEHIRGISAMLYKELEDFPFVQINSSQENGSPYIFHFSAPGLKPEVLIHMLGEKEIFVSTKSACSSKTKDESRVLLACGHDNQRAATGIRVSMSYETTHKEIETFIQSLQTAIKRLSKVME